MKKREYIKNPKCIKCVCCNQIPGKISIGYDFSQETKLPEEKCCDRCLKHNIIMGRDELPKDKKWCADCSCHNTESYQEHHDKEHHFGKDLENCKISPQKEEPKESFEERTAKKLDNDILSKISDEAKQEVISLCLEKIGKTKAKILKKARITDYADRTEYDECVDYLDTLSDEIGKL